MENTETSGSALTIAKTANIFGLTVRGSEHGESGMAIIIAPERLPPGRVRKVAALAEWQKKKALRYIDENVEKCIKVEDLAALVKLSTSRFSKAFKVSFGRSPYDYVLARRIEAAKYLVAFTDEPLSQVAHACGLSDQAHLSKVFKRLVGVTPLKYRRSGLRSHSNTHMNWLRLAPSTAAEQLA